MDDDLNLYERRDPRNDGWPSDRMTTATIDEIRYAEQLRLQIRAAYERKRTLAPACWSLCID